MRPLIDLKPATQASIFKKIKSKNLSARQVEKEVKKYKNITLANPNQNNFENTDDWEQLVGIYKTNLSNYLSTSIEIIKKSSIFVLLSYKEGTPRVVLEAMAMGRPIISADTPGCRETVKSGVNGFLVPKYDYLLAAEAMNKLLDADLRSHMGAQSRNYCEEKFDVDDVNRKMLSGMEIT